MAGVTSVVIDGTTYMVDDINAVDFSEDQGLSEQQQQQGRSNIGAAAAAALAGKADKTDLNALAGTVGDLSDDVDGLTEAMADKADVIVDTASGAIASFPDGAAVAAKDITIGIEPVQSGSGDPSPTNVRPISGWTGANVTRTGKNLVNSTNFESGAISTPSAGWSYPNSKASSTTRIRTQNLIAIPKGSTFTVSVGSGFDFVIQAFDENGLATGVTSSPFNTWTTSGTVCTAISPGNIAIALRYTNEGTISASAAEDSKLLVEFGSSASEYEPYVAPTVIPISWQSEAGTVYGGTLNVTTGLLTVDKGIAVFSSSASTGVNRNSAKSYYISPTAAPGILIPGVNQDSILSNMFKPSTSTSADGIVFLNAVGAIRFNTIKDYATVAEMLTDLGEIEFVYPLATPQTYQLTPTEVEMLLGENNVWADTGDSTVTYRADTKLYIQKINAPTDDDMIADAQIASGKYFIIGGNLYKSTTTIPAGDTINPGSNCILTNLADALNALNT